MSTLPPSVSASVVTLPIGPPSSDAYTSGEFLKFWPPQVLNPALMNVANSLGVSPHHFNNKRGSMDSMDYGTASSPTSAAVSPQGGLSLQQPADIVVACPFEPPPQAKRRRRCFGSAPSVSYEELDATNNSIRTTNNSGSMDDEDSSAGNFIWQMMSSAGASPATQPPGSFPHAVAVSEDEMQMN